MSQRLVVPSLREFEEGRKRKRSKKKKKTTGESSHHVEIEAPIPEPLPVPSVLEGEEEAAFVRQLEMGDDADYTTMRIPRDASLFSNPSEFDKFSSGLLLGGDEEMLNNWGLQEATKKAATLQYQALECTMFFQKAVESSHRRIKDLEKSNTSLRKSSAEALAAAQLADGRANELEALNRQLQESLQLEANNLQQAVASFEKAKGEWAIERGVLVDAKETLTEQLSEMAYESMIRQRHDMAKEFLAGEHVNWTPEEWISIYERYLAGEAEPSDEEGDDEDAPPASVPGASDGGEGLD